MQVSFVSNYMNHHQLPLSEAFYRLTGGSYCFVATTPMTRIHRELGYRDMNHSYGFVLNAYDSEENEKITRELIASSDVVIYGAAPFRWFSRRIRQNKITFCYSERPYKIPTTPKNLLRRAAGAWLKVGRFRRKPLYLLAASAYAAADYNQFGNYRGKAFRWGYFTEVRRQNLDDLFARKRACDKVSLLWVARMVPLKHPEAAICVAEQLKSLGYDFRLELIGNGPMEQQLAEEIERKKLSDCVFLLGAMPPEKVREHMEASDIFLFTSDFNEGWGAVLNESMNSGCAVVASHAIGSVPFLLQDGENGLIYENGNQEQLNRKVMRLMDHPEERERLGRAACRTMEEQWNADVAAERLLKLAEHIRSGKPGSPFAAGPCSVAEILENDWFKG